MREKCDICGNELFEKTPPSDSDALCGECKKIVDLNKKKAGFNAKAVKKALKDSAHIDEDSGQSYFKCFYTGIPCSNNPGPKENNSSLNNAFDLTFDHKNPIDGDKGEELVVCLNIINQMKSNLTSDNFKEFVKHLAKHFEGEIDSRTLKEELESILKTGSQRS